MTDALEEAQNLYLQGKYRESLAAFEKIIDDSEDEEEEGIARGMAFYVRSSFFPGSQPDFEKIMENLLRGLELESPLIAAHTMLHFPNYANFGDSEEVLEDLRCLADEGNIAALNLMGALYVSGVLVEKDLHEALKWLLKGAEKGDPRSMMDAASVYDYPDFDGADDEKSEALLRKSADAGYPEALYSLGRDYYEGVHEERDIRKAYELMERAAKAGYSVSAVDMWEQYLDNGGEIEEALPDISEDKLLTYLKKAADLMNDDAMYDLGQYYSINGDIRNAEKYLKQAMDMGNTDAQVELGGLYIFDKKSEKDHKKGISLLKEAAKEGNDNALSTLGACYLQGDGVKMNRKEAVKYLKKAVEAGSAEGMTLMVQVSLMDGKKKDAVKYAKMAADLGEPHGQFLLGSFYLMGEGVQENRQTAVFYLRSAAMQGVEEAQDLLNRINLGLV